MSQVKEFEFLHGVVLAKLVRTKGATMRLVETDTRKAWAAYRINDSSIVYVKYRLSNRESRQKHKVSWSFQFQPDELSKIAELQKDAPVWVALVCGLPEIEKKSLRIMQTCLLGPEQLSACIDFDSGTNQAISVEYREGASLRVYGAKNSDETKKLVVPRNRLDEWEAPNG